MASSVKIGKPPRKIDPRSAMAEWEDDERFIHEMDDFELDLRSGAPGSSPASTALAGHCWRGEEDGVRSILASHPGLDLDAHGADFDVPLHQACLHGRLGCAKLLLEAGADPNLLCRYGSTPMEYAAICRRSSSGDICRLLAIHGARVDEPSVRGLTPFLAACSCANLPAAMALLSLGASLEALSPAREGAHALAAGSGRRGPRGERDARPGFLDWLESVLDRLDMQDELGPGPELASAKPRRL